MAVTGSMSKGWRSPASPLSPVSRVTVRGRAASAAAGDHPEQPADGALELKTVVQRAGTTLATGCAKALPTARNQRRHGDAGAAEPGERTLVHEKANSAHGVGGAVPAGRRPEMAARQVEELEVRGGAAADAGWVE